MAVLSIVIPTHREQTTIQGFLADLCVKSNIEGLQNIIVSDSGADDTKTYALEISDSCNHLQVVSSAKGRAQQMNSGANKALESVIEGDVHYLLFVHSDTQLPDDFDQWWRKVEREKPVWGFFRVHLSGKRWIFRMVAFFMNRRSSMTSVATGDQCLFVRSDIWLALDGFQPIAIMEDVDLSKRLRKLGLPLIHGTPVETSSRRWEQKGIIKTILLMWGLRLGYLLGVSPKHLARFYRF